MKNVTTTVNLNTQTVNMEIEQTLSCASTEYFKHVLALGEPVSVRELGLIVKWVRGISFDSGKWWVRSGSKYDRLRGQEVIYAWAYDGETGTAPRDEFSFQDIVEHLNRRDVEELFWGDKYINTTNKNYAELDIHNAERLLKGDIMAVKCDGIWYVSRETLEEFLLACGR
ncbi:hypothetical protein ABWF04_06360 [Pasteurella multocida]|uniref:hypothetical protein n=1 Tax=Pasteurella multocida TaxID=747 RepID=UPI003979F608